MKKGDRVRVPSKPGMGEVIRVSRRGAGWVDVRWDGTHATERHRREDLAPARWSWAQLARANPHAGADPVVLELPRDEAVALLACARTGWTALNGDDQLGTAASAAVAGLTALEKAVGEA